MNLSNIFDDLEKLKKEVWYLIKKVIPKLEELIGGSSAEEITQIKQQLNSQVEQIETLQSQMEATTSLANAANTTAQGLSSTVSNLQSGLSSAQEELDDISSNITTISQVVDGNSGSIIQLSNSLASIDAKATQALSAANDLNDDVVAVSNQAAASATKINTMEDDIEALNTLNSSQTQTLTTLSQNVETISSSIQQLEDEIANAKLEDCDVIYDMSSTDADVNRGFTSGMVGANFFAFDFSPYHTIRIYARLFSSNCIQEVRVHNRKLADITLFAAGPNPIILCVLKVLFAMEPALNRIQVGSYAKYTYSASTGTFTSATGASDSTFFIYRIEGIKK